MARHGETGGLLSAALLALMSAPAASDSITPYAVTLFGARMTNNAWEEIASLNDIGFRDTYLAGIALSRELAGTDAWALEVEGQTAKHFGTEHHWEFNGLLVARWRDFPWRNTVPTSAAFGLGASYATEVPREEIALNGESARLLVYWTAELEIGFPNKPWSFTTRLHHRSTGYGLLAENGGSNWIAFGIRRRF